MKRGVVLIAHNNDKDDYYGMAVYTAKRVNKYLDLPVTVITDSESITDKSYTFDSTIIITPDRSNYRKKSVWINKGRYKIFDLSPYDDTLAIDTDYLINSTQLLKAFENYGDFSCHQGTRWLMEGEKPEYVYRNIIPTLWATVMRFKKSKRVEQIFNMIRSVQENYEHYANIYGFTSYMYRNDYALTIAVKTANGHMQNPSDYFHWKLLHVSPQVTVYRDSETKYTLLSTDKKTGKKQYIKISDLDFHMLHKQNFMEIAT